MIKRDECMDLIKEMRVHGFNKRVIVCSRAKTIRGNYLALAD